MLWGYHIGLVWIINKPVQLNSSNNSYSNRFSKSLSMEPCSNMFMLQNKPTRDCRWSKNCLIMQIVNISPRTNFRWVTEMKQSEKKSRKIYIRYFKVSICKIVCPDSSAYGEEWTWKTEEKKTIGNNRPTLENCWLDEHSNYENKWTQQRETEI